MVEAQLATSSRKVSGEETCSFVTLGRERVHQRERVRVRQLVRRAVLERELKLGDQGSVRRDRLLMCGLYVATRPALFPFIALSV